jgi:hypothetical protein
MKHNSVIYHTICKRHCNFSLKLLMRLLELIRVQIRSNRHEFSVYVRDKQYYNICAFFHFNEPLLPEDWHTPFEIVKERLDVWTQSQKEGQ